MAFQHPELLVPSIFAFFCALYPAPWHIRNRNIATLGMIFWMTALNLVHIINSIAWSDNADIKARPWCDITVLVNIGYNYGLPLSHFILAKQLENCTSLRSDSPLYDQNSKRRHLVFDFCLAIFGPIVGFLVSLTCRLTRFNIVEGFGPVPGVYWDTWGVVWVAVVPIIIAFMCFGYTCKACYNIIRRRQQMLTILSKSAGMDRSHFWRLMILANAELGTCMLRAVFNMMNGTNGLDELSWKDQSRSLSNIAQIFAADINSDRMIVYRLQWYTVVACSFVFFLCFATSSETKRFYWDLMAKIFPFVPKYHETTEDRAAKGSYDTSGGYTSSSSTNPLRTQDSTDNRDDKEISIFELLEGPPASPHRSSRQNSDTRTYEQPKYRLDFHEEPVKKESSMA
ncbi:pheromone receptor 1 [Dioszegia hungarica]|uniref:Pheromone receptor 1 n=1 Tax=Dioszegia hungarica TaxID=4972 RepID=A0AA38HFE4_9TREE|nr:pheromone receptor 1 [Dioszegia hungarica]KAI9637959.1 pheromone receptor 1 [Dioszegia hungarica]